MATQYNSRFSGKYLSLQSIPFSSASNGKCCYGDGSFSSTTKAGCTGYFSQDTTVPCPSPSEIGMCCSCSAVVGDRASFNPKSNNGIQTGISKCDCEQKNGLWRSGNTIPANTDLKTIKRLCTTVYGIDIRLPKACCYSTLNPDGTYSSHCEDVCTGAECAGLGAVDTRKVFYSGGQRCLVKTPVGDPVAGECTPEQTAPREQLLPSCTEGVDCFANKLAGNCCTRDYTSETTSCATTTQDTCNGWWISSAYGLVSCENDYCGAITFPKAGVIPEPPVENLTELQTSTNIFTKLPQPGEIYQGGIYVGIFSSSYSDTPSELYGNATTGTGQHYSVRNDPFGTKAKRWILIVHPYDYGVLPFATVTDPQEILETSFYDGFFNTYGNGQQSYGPNSSTFKEIRGLNINGFIDWYVPSQDECAFISNELNYDFYIPNGFSTFTSDTYYMTSTVFYNRNTNTTRSLADQNLGNAYFVYGHHFGKPTVGKTTIISRTSPLNIRLCRRIYLED